AGHETTANTLTNVFLRIAQDARVMERLQQEIDQHVGREGTPLLEDLPRFKYLDNVFRETQRVHPVVPGVGRIAAADTEIAGYKVKQGTEVFVSFTGLLGSEDIWGCDAAEFKPDRWDGQINELAFIPFGSGPHMCPGMKMAIMESRITLIKLLQNFE
ncbi:cytochrome P450, partial [Chytriomyces sp. MP71]